MDLLTVSEIKCTSMAESALIWSGIGVASTATVILLLFVLQCFGMISLRSLWSGKTEIDHFSSLKQNPYANELNPDRELAE
jgi:hypothetical protein